MSDFNFMSSGLGDVEGGSYEEHFKEHMTAVLSLFISKALEDSVKYIDICKRNGVTKEDIEMALKYQTFKFFQNPNLNSELEEVKQEIKEYENTECTCDCTCGKDWGDECECPCVCGYWEYVDDDAEGSGEVENEAEAEGESEVENEAENEDEDEGEGESEGESEGENGGTEMDFNNIFSHFTAADGDVQEFARANLREIEVADRNFIHDVHRCYDSWDNWVPGNDMEKALFNAIESMTAHF